MSYKAITKKNLYITLGGKASIEGSNQTIIIFSCKNTPVSKVRAPVNYMYALAIKYPILSNIT